MTPLAELKLKRSSREQKPNVVFNLLTIISFQFSSFNHTCGFDGFAVEDFRSLFWSALNEDNCKLRSTSGWIFLVSRFSYSILSYIKIVSHTVSLLHYELEAGRQYGIGHTCTFDGEVMERPWDSEAVEQWGNEVVRKWGIEAVRQWGRLANEAVKYE